jgi:putative tricarboxylic transport membrane protein
MDASILGFAGQALLQLLTGQHLLFLILGVMLGLSVGLLPGLGGISGMALLLPFIYGMDQASALAMLVGLTAVTTTSDTFPSVLLGVPGSSGSQATVVDGFPLSKQGQGARALAAAFGASLCGGLIGAALLSASVLIARPMLLAIGFGEQLMLVLLALTFVGMLTGPSMLKGLAAAGIGLLAGTIGTAKVTAQPRMTFGFDYLYDGIPLVIVGLGVFAVPEILDVLRHQRSIAGREAMGSGWLKGLRDVVRSRWLVFRCGLLGSAVGALPGLGGTVVDWIAYGHTLQSTKDRENFGKGDIRGVIGPESANNAKEGGALIPTLFLGIPGSGTMALLLGAFVIIGITPGRALVTNQLDIVYVVIWSLALANIVGALFCIGLAKPIARITTIPYALIAPFMIALIFFAAFQASRHWGDLLALLAVGALGVFMKRFGWSRAALLIGFVLSASLEDAVYRTVQIYGFDILLRPLAMTLLGIAVICLFFILRARKSVGEQEVSRASAQVRLPQIGFALLLGIFVALVLLDARNLSFLAYVFPVSVAVFTGVLILITLGMLAFRREDPCLFCDAEAEYRAAGSTARPMSFYFGILAALPVLSALIGFLLAVPVFLILFLRALAGVSWAKAVAGALIATALLWALGDLLVLRYPEGLLQNIPVFSG